MPAAGQFVRERIPVSAGVPEACRLVLELVAASRDSQAEAAGPMTFRVVRRFRPSWATATSFLVFPLFVHHTEVCRVAVIEARGGSELLLEGSIDPDLHLRLVQLARVPQAAFPRIAPHPAAAGDVPAQAAGAVPARPPVGPESSIDLREPVLRGRRQTREDDEDFADLIPPPLLPPIAQPPASRPRPAARPGGPAFAPLPDSFDRPDARVNGNGGRTHRPEQAAVPPTRLHPLRPAQVTVTVDTGQQAQVTRLLILGRAPMRQPHEDFATLLTVNDPSLSVSKTHLSIELEGQVLWVTDRNSTNGTWIDEAEGGLVPVASGQRMQVPPGARVLIGERVLSFTRG